MSGRNNPFHGKRRPNKPKLGRKPTTTTQRSSAKKKRDEQLRVLKAAAKARREAFAQPKAN